MNIRPLIVIPTYDNPATVAAVVRDVLAETSEPVLVVDDGSQAPVTELLSKAAVSSSRLFVQRHAINRGKGAALKTAFAWALAHGYTHVVTMDGDGQHLAKQLLSLLAAAAASPWDLVVGVRVFPQVNVPGVSRFGREFSNFWIHFETGVQVRDSQSGMRVYPLFFVQNLKFLTTRYDFEVEAMTRLLWAGAGLTEVDVDVWYPPAAERVSHFKKFRDNVRISLLNTYLVVLSLLRLQWLRRSLSIKKKAPVWTGRSRGGATGMLILHTISRLLGLAATYVCLVVIAPYFYLFAPKAKRASLEFLSAVFPHHGWLRRRLSVVAHFYTFGMVLLDRLFQGIHRGSYFDLRISGRDLLDGAQRAGKGVILLTAHTGGWDLSTRQLANTAEEAPALVAAIDAGGPRTERNDGVQRASIHNERMPILAYKESLEKGGIVCMMGDRPLSERLDLVPFMGKLAAFDLTPFRLAMSVGAPLLYVFAFKTGFRTYQVSCIEAPQLNAASSRDRDAACEAAVRHFVGELERHVRRHPYQWFNFFPFFSARPAPSQVTAG